MAQQGEKGIRLMQGMNQLVIKINEAVEKGNFTARREGSRGLSGAAGDLWLSRQLGCIKTLTSMFVGVSKQQSV